MNLREVHDGLFVSGHTRGREPGYSYDLLVEHDIPSVFCVAPRADTALSAYMIGRGGYYIHEPLSDGKTIDAEKVWAIARRVFEHRRALVHCNAGRNRGPFIIALAMLLRGFEPDYTINHIRSLRPTALANPSFEAFIRKGRP